MAFYFWAPAARGGLHPLISMLGAGKAAPAQFPAAGRKFTRHSARGPEGPLERMTRFQTRYLHPKRGVTAFYEIHLLLQMDFFWVPAARGGLHHKGAGRTLCAPTKRTSPPDGLIRLAALGTWPYPRRGPMRTSAPTNGADHVGQGLRRPPLTARPPSGTACGGATSPAGGEAFLRGRMELATTKGSAPCGRLQSLPPTGGKVAFAQQMTDEGAESRTAHHPRGHPHQSA